MKRDLNDILYKDFDEMSIKEKEIYTQHKGWVVTNYMGVKTPLSSIRIRLNAYLNETKRSSIWD